MLLAFLSRHIVKKSSVRFSVDTNELDLFDATEADAAALADAELNENEEESVYVISPDGTSCVLEHAVRRTLQADAAHSTIELPSLHQQQSHEAAKTNLKQLFEFQPTVKWIGILGDQLTQEMDVAATFAEGDLKVRLIFLQLVSSSHLWFFQNRVLTITGGMHFFKVIGSMTAARLVDLGGQPLFACLGYQTPGMLNFITDGGNLHKLEVFLVDACHAFFRQVSKRFLMHDQDFVKTCCVCCEAALRVFRLFSLHSTSAACAFASPVIAVARQRNQGPTAVLALFSLSFSLSRFPAVMQVEPPPADLEPSSTVEAAAEYGALSFWWFRFGHLIFF